jgi:hypothetical protein
MPSRFGSEVAPPEELFFRVRSAVAATPAARTSTHLRTLVAAAVVPVLTAAVLLVTSHIAYHRPALRIHEGTPATVHLLVVLLLIVGLTLSATLVALGRGARGLGSGVVALFLVAVLVTPIYAVLTLIDPLEVSRAATASLPTLSPWAPPDTYPLPPWAECERGRSLVAVLVAVRDHPPSKRNEARRRLRGGQVQRRPTKPHPLLDSQAPWRSTEM